MPVTLEHCERTKSGKALRVKLSGAYYNAFLDSRLDQLPIGAQIEAEITTSEKFGPGVKSWRPYTGPGAAPVAAPATPVAQPATPTTREPVQEPQYAKPAAPNTVAPFWWASFSNIASAAVQAGLIKQATDLQIWHDRIKGLATDPDSQVPF